MVIPRLLLALSASCFLVHGVRVLADPAPGPETLAARGVEELFAKAKESVVVITADGRTAGRGALGSGFFVSPDGLIATNLHVIGEGRPIRVRTISGRRLEVTGIHASDRQLDLAILRVDAKDLPALPLGTDKEVKDGAAVIAIGNPLGLEHSVVSGVVSAKRILDGRPMLQVAIPVESGNSGGPLLDHLGRVQGIVTMKSRVTENLGFAISIDLLRPLLERPNPVPIQRWEALGALDPAAWEVLFDANWRQRTGRIEVDGFGSGFGGRSLCLSKEPPPAGPFELSVAVRMTEESGAAGLVFGSDGGQKHFGFYPTAGRCRLTRFDGADVSSWNILAEATAPDYRPGEWNRLGVRVDRDKISCFVNGTQLFESPLSAPLEGRVGLAKFRDTRAEFRGFRVGDAVARGSRDQAARSKVEEWFGGPVKDAELGPELVSALAPHAPASAAALRDRARALERQAAQLRQAADQVHATKVVEDLVKTLEPADEEADLLAAVCHLARLDDADVDADAIREEIARMAREIRSPLKKEADERARFERLNDYLFKEQGFHGSRVDDHHRVNSYLHRVLEDREGLPITLSVLYMELARRLDLKVVGVGLPGHFVVRFHPSGGEGILVDVFDGGKTITRDQADERVEDAAGRPLVDDDLEAATKRSIVVRMLRNLLGSAQAERDGAGALRYLGALVALDEEAADARWMRALLLAQADRKAEAIADVDWLIEHHPAGLDLDRVLEFRRLLERR